jgi:hypothetical protein
VSRSRGSGEIDDMLGRSPRTEGSKRTTILSTSISFFPAFQSVRHVAAHSQGAKEPKRSTGWR